LVCFLFVPCTLFGFPFSRPESATKNFLMCTCLEDRQLLFSFQSLEKGVCKLVLSDHYVALDRHMSVWWSYNLLMLTETETFHVFGDIWTETAHLLNDIITSALSH
jgi:hypothetical protein